ncbi:hypothetical protein [Palaeococcus sp. (in: euryarchaeotes)]
MKKKIISLTHGTTATITVTEPLSPLGWFAEIHGVFLDKNIHLTLSGEEIWRFLFHLIEEAEYYERKYPDSKEKEILEKYVPKEYIKLAKELKKKEWEIYEDRHGEYPIQPGITASLNPKYRPPIIRFTGNFLGQFFEIRLTDLVDMIKTAMGLVELAKKSE